MRLSRWGRSPYEMPEDIRIEAELLSEYAQVVAEQADAEIIVVHSKISMGAQELAEAPSLQLLITTTSGWDHIDMEAFTRAGVKVCRLPEARRDAVVDASLAMLIWGLRRLGTQARWAQDGVWGRKDLPQIAPVSMQGARIGVVGLGVIGSRMSEVLGLLGAEVWGCDPRGLPPTVRAAKIDEMLGHCDALTLHCDLNSSSNNILSSKRIASAHPNLVVVNTARGALLDVDAACSALCRGELGALALDVFPVEPYPDLARVDRHPDLMFTPHSAGFHRGLASDIRHGLKCAVLAHLSGTPLPHQVA